MEHDDDVYKVTLYKCAMPWPLSLAIHMWFVIEHNGSTKRVEVWAPLWLMEGEVSTVVINALLPEQGFRTTYFDSPKDPKHTSIPTKVIQYEGGVLSVTKKLYDVIDTALLLYPSKNVYRLWPGPNSNTFIMWVAQEVPEAKLPIPWNAFGKNYKSIKRDI